MRTTVIGLVIAIAFIACKQEKRAEPERTSPAMNCLFAAKQANEYFGSRVGSFTNNTSGWDSFKSEMDSRLSNADSQCSCSEEACRHASEAINELRAMVNDMDSAVRSGSGVPEDLVQRQERVDQALEAAQNTAK